MDNGTIKRTDCQAWIFGSEAGRARKAAIQRRSTIPARSCPASRRSVKSYVTSGRATAAAAAAAKRANRGGGAHRKTREKGSQTAHRTDKGAEATTPTGAQGPAAGPPTTDQSGEPGGRAAKRTRGGGRTAARGQSRAANSPHRPPGAAAPRAQGARSAQKGRDGRRPGPTRRRYNESPMATRTIRFVSPRADPRSRKLGDGITAPSSANAVCASAPAQLEREENLPSTARGSRCWSQP